MVFAVFLWNFVNLNNLIKLQILDLLHIICRAVRAVKPASSVTGHKTANILLQYPMLAAFIWQSKVLLKMPKIT